MKARFAILVVFSMLLIFSYGALQHEQPTGADTITGYAAEKNPQSKIINGKTLEQRVQEAYDRLHTIGAGRQIRTDFPDIKLVYTDFAAGKRFPREILPFEYYYSKEADKTFNICAVDFTVFICNGKMDKAIYPGDPEAHRCKFVGLYQAC